MLFAALAMLAQDGPITPSPAPQYDDAPRSITFEAGGLELLRMSEAALARGDIKIANEILTALLKDAKPEIRNEARFRLAMLAIRAKEWTTAGTYLRAILDEEPGAQRARLELARVQAEMGQIDASQRTLREAQAGGLPPEVARLVERFSAALRENKPFGANVRFAFAPDSNINRATRSDTLGTVIGDFELDEDAQQSSGIGLSLHGDAYFRQRLSKRASLLARAGISGAFYRASRFNDLLAVASVGPEFALSGGRATMLGGVQRRWFGGERYYDAVDANLQWTRALGARSQMRAGLGYSHSNFRANALQDANTVTGFVTYEQAIDSRTGASATIGGARQMARDPAYSTASGYVSVTGWRDIDRATLFGIATYQRLEADKRLAIYPKRREDDFLSISFGATMRALNWRGWAPQFKLGWERNWSPIEIYDYRRWRGELGVTRAF